MKVTSRGLVSGSYFSERLLPTLKPKLSNQSIGLYIFLAPYASLLLQVTCSYISARWPKIAAEWCQ